MFDSLVQAIADYPYLGVAMVFFLCGIGFPLPEELVLIAGGYVCAKFPEQAALGWMMVWCGSAIMAFDLLPFVLGRTLGARVLRIRWLRLVVTRRRLAQFDRWFRRRGDLVIFFARFLAGIRVIAFFTAGLMKMRWRRFLLLDGLGIAIIVPLMVWLGHHFAGVIDDVIAFVQAVERGMLFTTLGLLIAVGGWLLWRRQKRRADRPVPAETFVEPRLPVQATPEEPATPRAPAEPRPTAAPAPAATQPGATQPQATQPAETQPSGTQPSGTQPSGTQSAETQPAETQSAETQPTGAEPSAAEPPPAGPAAAPPGNRPDDSAPPADDADRPRASSAGDPTFDPTELPRRSEPTPPSSGVTGTSPGPDAERDRDDSTRGPLATPERPGRDG